MGWKRAGFLLVLAACAAALQGCACAEDAAASLAAPPPPPPKRKGGSKWRAKGHRRPCAENDAKCIALRDHECDPYYKAVDNLTDICTFVQWNRHCEEDVRHINYLQLFYCRPNGDPRVLVALGFLAWMAVLFWTMSKVAEDFLVPALEFLAYWLRLAPDVAGVTLFAFASGAPDLFTQIAAVAVGGTVDQELAIGATLGAGLFIIAVIFSIVMLVAKPADGESGGGGSGAGGANGSSGGGGGLPEEITDRRAFVRDAVAYLLSTLALLALMLRGTFAAWEAGLLLAGYGVYLAVCLMTSRGGAGAHRHSYFPVTPSQQALSERQQELVESGAAGGGGGGASQHGGRQLNGVLVAGGAAVVPGVAAAVQEALPRAQIELVSRTGGPQQLQRKTARAVSPPPERSNGGRGSRPPSPMRGKLLDQWQQQQGGDGGDGGMQENELALLVSGTPPSDTWQAGPVGGTPGTSPHAAPQWQRAKRASGGTPVGAASGASSMALMLHSCSVGLEELLHTKGRSGPRLWFNVAMAPATLLLHATMPALHAGHYTPQYALLLALCAPLFTLLSTELYPRHLGTQAFLLAWLLAALVLYALLVVAVAPSGPAGSAGGAAAVNGSSSVHGSSSMHGAGTGASPPAASGASGSPFGSTSRLARLSPGGGGLVGGSSSSSSSSAWGRQLGRCWAFCGSRRLRRNVLMSLLASVQCMLWMSLAADELVALFQAIGRIGDVSQDVLGATVLAWGEAVPELVATISLARAGQATMAIAAVFGGPIFNVLIAWAGPTLYAALRHHGPLEYSLSAGVAVLVAFTVCTLAFLLLAMPLLFRWRLARQAAFAVLGIYGLSQALFLLTTVDL